MGALTEAPTFVQGRLSDTNANLVARSLVVASELAAAMGPAWDRTARDFLKPALEGLADKKKQVCALYPVQILASSPVSDSTVCSSRPMLNCSTFAGT